ncbi:hypothetical protein A9R05_44160 (plasmid) [Burkholderia sp. KK1]|uniref:Lipoprotein n=1 Tax=Burkholderia sp. M701 TaxID=326454 RepID=V5YQG7_9BURK|nr:MULTISPECIES: hypothetical protein [Burkholderia]AQH05951.1 hypothetical protein A9R05_44160 [Burkholderia sp. KK1]BAO19181.1 putative lipoprotein [Burkholderia sp. M701]
MKKISFLVPVIVAAMLAGCATAGNEHLESASQETVGASIVQGKSTKADVSNAYGAANKVSFTDSGLEIWTYEYAHATPKAINFVPVANLFVHGADVQKKSLTVLFDDKGVVKKFTFAASNDVVKGGIGQ